MRNDRRGARSYLHGERASKNNSSRKRGALWREFPWREERREGSLCIDTLRGEESAVEKIFQDKTAEER